MIKLYNDRANQKKSSSNVKKKTTDDL